MRVSEILVATAVTLLVGGCVVPVGAPPIVRSAVPTAGAYGATEARIFDLINAERRHSGLPPLIYNEQLDRMAKIQAENMARFQKMAHTIPGAQLPTLGDRARYVGYPYGPPAETLALGYPNGKTVVVGWMNWTGRRLIILDA